MPKVLRRDDVLMWSQLRAGVLFIFMSFMQNRETCSDSGPPCGDINSGDMAREYETTAEEWPLQIQISVTAL